MKRRSALIIGGGISGLAAARELGRNNITVTLLEAKRRFGGRIHTVQAGRVPIELGAEFLHGQSTTVINVLKEANVATEAVLDEHKIFANGRFERIDLWKTVGDVFHRINPRARDCSFEKFINAQTLGVPVKTLARNFVGGFDAADPGRVSVHALLRAEYSAEHMENPEQARIAEGYSALVHFFEKELAASGCELVTGATARRIGWKRGHVDVLAERNNRLETYQAPAAIVTLPLGVLKTCSVSFEPVVPGKQEAICDLAVGNAVKLIFHFRDAFWDGDGFIHAFDERIPTWWTDPRGAVLTGWAGGPKAEELTAMSAAELESLGLEILGKIFSNPRETLREQLIEMHCWNWAEDVRVRGAYSFIPVGGLDLPKQLAAPVAGTLFFAGEATVSDAQTGTVGGALESGLRAARELMES